MSNTTNTSLLEEARDYLDSGDLDSTPLRGMIEADIKANDLEALWAHVLQARDMLRDE